MCRTCGSAPRLIRSSRYAGLGPHEIDWLSHDNSGDTVTISQDRYLLRPSRDGEWRLRAASGHCTSKGYYLRRREGEQDRCSHLCACPGGAQHGALVQTLRHTDVMTPKASANFARRYGGESRSQQKLTTQLLRHMRI